MRARIAAILLAFVMVFGFAQAATAPVASVAQADTYTSVRHVCASSTATVRLETKWGSGLYYRDLKRCYNGPTGTNGGHIPKRYLVPRGYCGRINVYNNGTFVTQLVDGPGWHSVVANRANMIKIYPC